MKRTRAKQGFSMKPETLWYAMSVAIATTQWVTFPSSPRIRSLKDAEEDFAWKEERALNLSMMDYAASCRLVKMFCRLAKYNSGHLKEIQCSPRAKARGGEVYRYNVIIDVAFNNQEAMLHFSNEWREWISSNLK